MSAKTDEVLRRQPPQSLDAEQSVLGAILIADNQAEIVDLISGAISAEDFYYEKHREIYGGMIDLSQAKVQIDALTLSDILKSRGVLEQIGGPQYLGELADAVPTTAGVSNYTEIIWRMARFREFALLGTDLVSQAYDAKLSLDGFMGDAESRMARIFDRVFKLNEQIPREDRISQAQAILLNGIPHERVIEMGFPLLDQKVWLMPGDLITIGAETSVGKTTIAGNIALAVAKGQQGVIFFTYEMSEDQLNQRLICTLGEVSADRGKWGQYDEVDKGRIEIAADYLKALPLGVVWARGYRPKQIRTEIRRQRRELNAPLRLILVDYLQLMKADKPNRNRDQDFDDIVAGLKDFAGEFDCAVILLSQFNREATKRSTDKVQVPPRVSDCKGSSAIEQYSDGIWLLWQPEKDLPTKVELLVAKNRNGSKARVPLQHIPEMLRFEPRKTYSSY